MEETIKSALALMEESYCIVEDLDGTPAKRICRRLRQAKHSLHRAWEDSHLVSFANAGIQYASTAMANVGARAVHGGLRSLLDQTLWLGTSTKGQKGTVLTPSPDMSMAFP